MRRSLPATLVVVVGLLLLVDFVIINPILVTTADAVLRLIVLLTAAAALAGGTSLVMRHGRTVLAGGNDRLASVVLLSGFGAMLLAGLYPGSEGASDVVVRWLVGALLAPLVASLFAMLFIFLLIAMRRGMALRSRQMTVMLLAAAIVIVLLLPLGGGVGEALASAASWTMAVPIGGVFRGLLIGVGIVIAVHAARVLLGVNADD